MASMKSTHIKAVTAIGFTSLNFVSVMNTKKTIPHVGCIYSSEYLVLLTTANQKRGELRGLSDSLVLF